MRTLLTILMFFVFLTPTPAISTDEGRLALVTSNLADNETLDIKAIRKLYLGFASQSQIPLVAIVNLSDEQLYQSFLQRVMYMSAKKFRRLSVSMFYRRGGQLTQNISDSDALIEKQKQGNRVVSFIWAKDIKRYPDLKVIKIL